MKQAQERKKGRGNSGGTFTAGPYVEALNDFWRQDYTRARETISSTLAETPDHIDAVLLYRLWIEIAATQNLVGELRTLADHLFVLAQMDEENYESLSAIRGIAHLEMDEINAGKLINRGLKGATENTYACELSSMVQHRLGNEIPPVNAHLLPELRDFATLCNFVRLAVAANREKEVGRCLGVIKALYPAAPFVSFSEMHLGFEGGMFDNAALEAHKLTLSFPENPDFNYYAAYFAFRRNNFTEAAARLEQARSSIGNHDPDIEALTALSHRELARRHDRPEAVELAKRSLEKAIGVLRESGFPIADLGMRLQGLNDNSPEDADPILPESVDELRPTRIWMVKLSPRRYHEFATASDREIEFLTRSLGGEARTGDICFFASDDFVQVSGERRRKGRQWRIAAIFAVVSEPMWNPMTRCENGLQLISRLAAPIRVDVVEDESIGPKVVRQVAKDHPSRFGVFELEDGALDIISEAIAQKRMSENKVAKEDYETPDFRIRKLS